MDSTVSPEVEGLNLGVWAKMAAPFGISAAGRVAKSQKLIKEARAHATTSAANAYSEAIQLYTRAIDILTHTTGMDAERQLLLGPALWERGAIQELTKDTSGALQSYLQVRQSGSKLPPAALQFTAAALATRQEQNPETFEIYFELLRTLKGGDKPAAIRSVYGFLEKCCMVEETTSRDEAQARTALCTKVIEADPGITWAHYYIGIACYNWNEYAEAIRRLKQARTLGCAKPLLDFYLDFASVQDLLKRGKTFEAIPYMRKASKSAPKRADSSFLLGKTLIDLCSRPDADVANAPDWLAEAADCLASACRVDPAKAEYAFYLGHAQSLRGDFSAAAQAFEQATRLDSQKPDYFVQLGHTLKQIHAYSPAIAAIQAAIALDREYVDGHRLLAELLLETQRYGEAVKELQMVLLTEPGDLLIRTSLGFAHYSLGRFEDAVATLYPIHNQYPQAAFLLARSYAHSARFDLAVTLLESLAAQHPTDPDTTYYLALSYGHTGQLPVAIEAFGNAIRLDLTQARFYLQRGHALVKSARLEEARADYAKAVALQPEDPEFLFALGRVCLAIGDTDAAIAHLTNVHRLDPNHAEARLALGNLFERAGRIEEALTEYLAAATIDPYNPTIFRRMGVLHWKQKDTTGAGQDLERAVSLGDDSDEILYYLGLLANEQNDYARTVEVWGTLYTRHPDDERLSLNLNRLHYLLGKQHCAAHRYADTIIEWNAYLALRPNDDQLKAEIGKLHFFQALQTLCSGGASSAATAKCGFHQAAALSEKTVYSYYAAFCDLVDGQCDAFLQSAQSLMSDLEPSLQVHAKYHIGIAWLMQNAPENAQPFLDQAKEEASGLGQPLEIDFPLAVIHARAGRWEEAAQLLLSTSDSPQPG